MRWSLRLAAMLLVCSAVVSGQTVITPPKNKYSPADDVKLGREAAAQAEKELPLLRDEQVVSYVADIGDKLVEAVLPPHLNHPEFRYTFKVVNFTDINAFAMPGGPMFINRGMIEKARTEAEVAGVMAHELSHVVLRHGTAQATQATPYAIGGLLGAIAGAVIGGTKGRIIAEGSQFGLGAYFLRFSREYEKQADILGAQIMARAGYDPRQMATMFQLIQKEGGSGGPQFLSDHPDPGNRIQYINREAELLRVQNPVRDTARFQRTQSHLRTIPAAPSAEQWAKNRSPERRGDEPLRGQIQEPSSTYRAYTEGDLFQVRIPINWRERPASSTVTFAPDGAYGQGVFTHGIEFGATRDERHTLRDATGELIDSMRQGNPGMRVERSGQSTVDGRQAIVTELTNAPDRGRPEWVQIVTTLLPDGNLFYAVAVAPQDEMRTYTPVFRQILRSVRFVR